MTTIVPSAAIQPSQTKPIESCQATLFKVADHWLALPTTAIVKVFPSSTVDSQQQSELLVWNNRPLVRLNLHRVLSRNSIDRPSARGYASLESSPYTLMVGSQTGERCSIPVDEMPVLQVLSLSDAQVLPPHYRQAIYNLAKHMVIHSYQGIAINILLLDLQQALNTIPSMKSWALNTRMK